MKYKKDLLLNIAGGLIATVIFSVFIWINSFDNKIKISYFFYLLIAFLFAIWLVFLYFKFYRFKTKNIFIISSSFTSATFFSELLKNLIRKIEGLGFTPILKLPQEDFKLSEIERYIKIIEQNTDNYLAGFIILSDPVKQSKLFLEFSKKFKKPLIFLDSRTSEVYNSFDENCSFIGFDNQKTGVLAGNEAVRILKKIKAKYPKILIIASTMQEARQDKFIQKIRENYNKPIIKLIDNIEFNRRKSHKIVFEELQIKISTNKSIYDLIFCTNDEMALGALNAIQDLNSELLSKIKIIGVDGIEYAKNEIDKNEMFFVNTVNQNPQVLAEKGVNILAKKLRNENTDKIILIEPEMYIHNE